MYATRFVFDFVLTWFVQSLTITKILSKSIEIHFFFFFFFSYVVIMISSSINEMESDRKTHEMRIVYPTYLLSSPALAWCPAPVVSLTQLGCPLAFILFISSLDRKARERKRLWPSYETSTKIEGETKEKENEPVSTYSCRLVVVAIDK